MKFIRLFVVFFSHSFSQMRRDIADNQTGNIQRQVRLFQSNEPEWLFVSLLKLFFYRNDIFFIVFFLKRKNENVGNKLKYITMERVN